MYVCLSVRPSVCLSVTPAVSGVRGADEQQKTEFGPHVRQFLRKSGKKCKFDISVRGKSFDVRQLRT